MTSHDDILFTSRDGLELHARRYGHADNLQVLLCLPGLTRNGKDFHATAQRLSPGWQVLTVDYRGRGKSAWAPKPRHYTLSWYAEDAWRLLDHLAVDQAVIVGTSLGGLVGMCLAAEQPGRVRGLVLNDIGPEIPASAVRRIAQYVRQKGPVNTWTDAVRRDRAMYAASFPGAQEEFWQDFARLSWRENTQGVPVPDIDPGVVVALRRQYLRDRLLNVFKRLMFRPTSALPFDAWAAFQACQAPTLLIRGALSDVTDARLVGRMLQARPDMQVVDVPRRGHAPTLDEPEAMRALDAFLDKLARPRPCTASGP